MPDLSKLDQVRGSLVQARASLEVSGLKSRELSLVLTKIQEAEHWLEADRQERQTAAARAQD